MEEQEKLEVLFSRLMSCQASRDAEYEKLRFNNPMAHYVDLLTKRENLSEVDRAKVLACVMAWDVDRLDLVITRLAQTQPVQYVLQIPDGFSPEDFKRMSTGLPPSPTR